MKRDDQYWKENLTTEQYRILREKGTETPFSGKLLDEKRDGMFACGACGAGLFTSDAKYESNSGWPSFYDVANEGSVGVHIDSSHGMERLEATCTACGGHLGHVFDDGPDTTGKRYCINSESLEFKPKEDSDDKS